MRREARHIRKFRLLRLTLPTCLPSSWPISFQVPVHLLYVFLSSSLSSLHGDDRDYLYRLQDSHPAQEKYEYGSFGRCRQIFKERRKRNELYSPLNERKRHRSSRPRGVFPSLPFPFHPAKISNAFRCPFLRCKINENVKKVFVKRAVMRKWKKKEKGKRKKYMSHAKVFFPCKAKKRLEEPMPNYNATPTRRSSSAVKLPSWSWSWSSPLLLPRMTKSSITGGLLAIGVIIKLRLYRLEDFVGE
jgi:hypothetical protein